MEGWLRFYGKDSVDVKSVGLETLGVNPDAIEVMAESNVDISHHASNRVEEYLHEKFDLVITVCDHARENCPIFPGSAKRIHQNFTDPAKAAGTREEVLDEFRKVRDQIRKYAKSTVLELGCL